MTEDIENTKNTEKIKETEKQKAEQKKPKKGEDNIIYVGIKPFMNYVTAIVMQFQNKGQEKVIVSARGKFVSKAVDVTEVARRIFLKEENIQIENIEISSEQFENKLGKRIFVSTITIPLKKGKI